MEDAYLDTYLVEADLAYLLDGGFLPHILFIRLKECAYIGNGVFVAYVASFKRTPPRILLELWCS